ncbi:hypothetical protein CSA56_09120 [candidate division KSB3 bacterium]|uniref:Uncharacterized protein n=1 Tax=candidate division KSB3 bacterium TaxID=2044937 RepID=A0A2G6KEF9_9BACT|nr:MAG: hypothetical protein CSA56_09120 [candidate division KSB3 bacterium]
MKLSEKLIEGAGITLHYVGGLASIWCGLALSMVALIWWGAAGVSIPWAIFTGVFGLPPIAGGVWLFRRGKVLRQLLKVKLLKEDVRRLAFQRQGKLTPDDLARHHAWSEKHALNVLKNLVAEDPDRVELQLDYESGEIFFEFSDIMRALDAEKQYQALPISEAVGRKAAEIAMMLGKTIDTFNEYIAFTKETVSEHKREKKEEKYRAKIEQFLEEIDELKQE